MVRQIIQSDKARLRPCFLLAVGLTLLALSATSCGLTPSRVPRASDEWSKGKLVGMASLNNPVALQVDEGGNSFMVWVGLERELNFARLNERAEVVVQGFLDLRLNSPLKPQLLLDPTGRLHLTWLDRWEPNMQLFYALLSANGEVILEATSLSPPEQRVTHNSMVLDPVGQTLEIFWSDNVSIRPGCYHAALDWSGAVVASTEILIPDGILPVAQIDRQGFVHLAWRVESEGEQPQFHYAVYDPQRRALGPKVLVNEPLAQTSLLGGPTAGAKFDGPWLGLDESLAYLAWTLEVRERGGLSSFTFYQAFPLPALNERDPTETFDYPSPPVSGQAVHVRGADPSLTGHPRFLEGQPAHQALTCYTEVFGPGTIQALQITAIDLQAGQIQGQEIVNASNAASLRPNVAIDPSDNLHLAWIDTAGFNRYQVVYASTSSQVKETLNRITTYEVVDSVLSVVISVFSALFFVPIVLSWTMISFGWLFIFTMVTGESRVSTPRVRNALVLAMLLQLGIKLFFFPSLLKRPLLSSLLSPSLSLSLGRWIFPLLLALLSAGVAWAYLKRARIKSLFISYLIYGAVDSILTLVVYVTTPMG
jgi:hypothetical protein